MTSKNIAFVALFAAAPMLGCQSQPDVQGAFHEIRVGVLANFTNEYAATSGRWTMRAAELAASALNDAGGIDVGGTPHQLSLVFKDFEDRPDAASTAARALINQDEVDVLIGPQFSRHAVPVSMLAENARIPMISPMSSSPMTTKDKSYVFRLAFLDEVQARAMARFAYKELGARRAAMLYNVSSEYSRSLAEVFEQTLTSLGGEVVAAKTYTSDDAEDFRDDLEDIGAAQPDVLWLPNWTPMVALQLEQAKELGLDVLPLGSDTWDLRRLKNSPMSQGAYVSHQWHGELGTKEAREFVQLYHETYDETPGITAAMTFDAFGLLAKALREQEEVSNETIRAGLADIGIFEGVTGRIRFNNGGNPDRAAVIVRIDEGRAVLHSLVDASE